MKNDPPQAESQPLGKTLLAALLVRLGVVAQAMELLESAARMAASMGVGREQFVKAIGELSGILYDVATRPRPPEPPGDVDG